MPTPTPPYSTVLLEFDAELAPGLGTPVGRVCMERAQTAFVAPQRHLLVMQPLCLASVSS